MADEADDLLGELLTGMVEDRDVPAALDATIHGLYVEVGRWMGNPG